MGDIGCQCNLRKPARIDRPVIPSTASCKFVGLPAEQPRSSAPVSDQVGMTASGRLYTPPDTISRQAMRANLLARATATSFGGFRSSRAASHGEGLWRPLRMCLSTAVAPTISVERSAESPAFVMPPCRWRPPVE